MSANIKRKKRKSASQRRRRSSQVKADYNSLEQRLALTTFVVTSLDDNIASDGVVTLREAIVAANTNSAAGDAAAGDVNGDVIQFDVSLFQVEDEDGNISLEARTIELSAGQLTISDDLAIQAGNLDLTVDALGLSRVFEVTSFQTVSLGQINVTGGTATIGGGVLVSGSGNLIVFGGEYSGNTATGEGGGAIYSGLNSDLFVAGDATFDNNVAEGISGSGGAVLNVGGDLVAIDANFTSNVANRAGGAIEILDGSAFLVGINANGNIAGPNGGFAAPGNGGALHVTAGDLVSVTNSTISNNVAALEGGGLWNQAGTRLIVTGSTLNNNVAQGAGADNGGGAIYNNGGDLVVNGSDLGNNSANGAGGSGGAIFSVDGRVIVQSGSTLSNNASARAGGAVELVDGQIFDVGSTYSGNNTGVFLTAAPGNGGAFHITGTGSSVFNGTQFVGNVAESEGGAVWNSASSTTFINNASFTGNIARGDDATNGGGGVFNNGGSAFVNGSTFSNNEADGAAGSGGAIFSVDGRLLVQNFSSFFGNASVRAGGAIEIIDGEFFDVDTFYSSNETGVSLPASPGNGGAIHTTGTVTLGLTRSFFLGNQAGSEGGAVWTSAATSTFIINANFSSNIASGDDATNGGGALFNNGGEVLINAVTFDANLADGLAGSGGAIFSVDGRVAVRSNSQFSNNLSARAGGAVEVIDGGFFDTGSTYTGNQTGNTLLANPGNGGAFHSTGAATASFLETEFNNNLAGSEGGAIWTSALSTTFLTDVEIVGNIASGASADNGGGGIFNNGGDVFVRDSTISGNFANGIAGSGGGALSVDGLLQFVDTLIIDNNANRAGGGVELINGRVAFTSVNLEFNNTGSSISGLANPGNGGGLHISGNNGIATFVDSSVNGNTAANQGGGLWNEFGSMIFVDNTPISNNTAQTLGGGVYNRGFLSVVDSAFEGNRGLDDGGGIYNTPTSVTRFEDSSLTSNTASDDGGGVFNLGRFTTEGSTFTSNFAGGVGGAIFTAPTAETIIGLDNFFAFNNPSDQN